MDGLFSSFVVLKSVGRTFLHDHSDVAEQPCMTGLFRRRATLITKQRFA